MKLASIFKGPSIEEAANEYLKRRNKNIDNFLQVACEDGYIRAVDYALDHGADIDFDEGNPINAATRNGHNEVVRYLVERGAELNNRFGFGFPLRAYTEKGNLSRDDLETAEYLLEHGADPDSTGTHGGYMLDMAIISGKDELIKLMLDYGATVTQDMIEKAKNSHRITEDTYEYLVEKYKENS